MKAIKYITIAVAAILLLAVASCKKDDTGSGLSVTGKYRLLDANNPLPQYYLFYDNNTYTKLIQTVEGAHSVVKGVYNIRNSVLTLSENYTLYKIEQSGDTLKLLTSPGQPSTSDRILLTDAATPAEETWVQKVTPTQLIPTANLSVSGMGVVGTKLYTAYQYESYIHIFDLAASIELPQIDAGQPYRALTNSGSNLFAANSMNKLYKLNTDGTMVTEYNGVTNQMYAIACNGATVYSYSTTNNRFGSFNTATATNLDMVDFEQNITSLCFKGGYLYGTSYNYIFKIDPATYQVVKSYYLTDGNVAEAIASDGTNVWIHLSTAQPGTGYIAKVTLD
jgi:hypothetical protein